MVACRAGNREQRQARYDTALTASLFGLGSERTPAVGKADGDVRGRRSRVVLTPGVLASSLAVMWRPTGARIDQPQGDGGNSATLPEESTKDTVKTIAQGRPGDRHHLSSTPCAFFAHAGLRVPGGARPSLRPCFRRGRKKTA
ncbi:hypothetical protein C7U89_03915 [Bradyrhizobium sp. WBOS4]|nr:hypothetical protein [Bradyrhizobium sp. WBOS8]MDD1582098.1 hypothetical protein [Bradyrhizobium sp. WBOS4]UUO47325.1 hypothetical protein DCM78_10555 [Bradyrhizobium sp. WBOS04]UUO60942.1 hypothetical protein DCM80_18295 [Bradyrhizobium sp. WBOS08]